MPRDRRFPRWLQGLRPRRDRNTAPREPISPPADTVPLTHSKTPKPIDSPDSPPDSPLPNTPNSGKTDRSLWQTLRQRAENDIDTVSSFKTRFTDRRTPFNPADSSGNRGIDIDIVPDSAEIIDPDPETNPATNPNANPNANPETPLWLDRLRPKQLENQLNQQFQQFQARQRDARQDPNTSDPITGEPNATEREPLATQFDRILNNLPALPQLPPFDRADIERRFETFARNAKPGDIGKIIQQLPDMNRGPMREIWPKVRSLLEMIRDPSAAWSAKALAIGALVYLISPLDAIPDFIPFVGLLDDAALIVAVVATLARELDRYMRQSMQASVETAERLAEIEVKKYNRIVRITLLGSIATALITIGLKLWLDSN